MTDKDLKPTKPLPIFPLQEQQSRASTSVSNLCLPLAMRYFHTGYFEFWISLLQAFFYPNAASETQSYSALVNLAGMVGAQSEHAETAYSFLRSIMDLLPTTG